MKQLLLGMFILSGLATAEEGITYIDVIKPENKKCLKQAPLTLMTEFGKFEDYHLMDNDIKIPTFENDFFGIKLSENKINMIPYSSRPGYRHAHEMDEPWKSLEDLDIKNSDGTMINQFLSEKEKRIVESHNAAKKYFLVDFKLKPGYVTNPAYYPRFSAECLIAFRAEGHNSVTGLRENESFTQVCITAPDKTKIRVKKDLNGDGTIEADEHEVVEKTHERFSMHYFSLYILGTKNAKAQNSAGATYRPCAKDETYLYYAAEIQTKDTDTEQIMKAASEGILGNIGQNPLIQTIVKAAFDQNVFFRQYYQAFYAEFIKRLPR